MLVRRFFSEAGKGVQKDYDGSFSLLLNVGFSTSVMNLDVVETFIILVSAVSVVGAMFLFVTSTLCLWMFLLWKALV